MSQRTADNGRPPGENLRVRRTRILLREALVGLIEERGFDRITIGAVTERAMVSRAAFYRNYRDKYHLVEQIFDEAMGELLPTIVDADTRPPRERWVAFFEHIAGYRRLYAALLGKGGSPWFAARMRARLAEMVSEHLPPAPSPTGTGLAPAADLTPTVLAALFVESIAWWLAHDRPCSATQIALRTGALAGAVIAEANTWGTTDPA